MFERLLRAAEAHFRSFLEVAVRGAKALCEPFGSKNDPETRGLTLLQMVVASAAPQYQAKGYFEVTGCDSGKRYQIITEPR